ncbi:hypothetical protein CRUP_016452, partial [Coryphaenoides rupestris]
ESYQAISSWREKVEVEVGDIPTVLVQNKIDLLDDTVIKNEEAEGLAKRLKLRFYRASVKEDLNVNEVFKYLAEKYLQRLKQQTAEEPEVVHTTSNKIGSEEAEGLAKRLKLRFYRASVKEDLNVNEVFKYLAEKYLQRLKQQTAEEPEVVHTTSNKIGVFNTTSTNVSNQSSTNGHEVISLRPNKQRTKKTKNPFGSCSLL